VENSPERAIALARTVLGYLPQNSSDSRPWRQPRQPAVADPRAGVPFNGRRPYDVLGVVAGVVDAGSLLELSPRWARNLVTAFGRVEGLPVGIVANQPRHLGGLLDVDACQKAAQFISTCDRFRIPLLVLVDTPGFLPGTKQETGGVIRHGACLVRAFAAATVPRVTLVLRKAYGGAYIAMNSKGLGADLTMAWRGAEIGIMSANQAVGILHRREIAAAPDSEAAAAEYARRYAERHLTADAAAAEGVIDEVIAPERSREQLAWALSVLTEAPHEHPTY
jgi:acetyl-CoA carboxylase carboxyltransferase component